MLQFVPWTLLIHRCHQNKTSKLGLLLIASNSDLIISYSTTEQHGNSAQRAPSFLAPRQQRRHNSTTSTTCHNIRIYDVIIGGNPKGNAPGSATHSRLISVPQRQASRVNIPQDNTAMDHRLPTLRNPWNRTFQSCNKCGFGHFDKPCPASNKVCYQCNKFGHFAKQCTSKTKTKSPKRLSRDQERIQKFYNKVMLIKELPFVNVRNAAFLNCMNFNAALKTELSETKAKLKKNVKLCKIVAEDSKHQIETAQQKNSELQQKVLELQNKLSTVQLNDNKIQDLEKNNF